MDAKFRNSLEPLDTIVLCCSSCFRRVLNLAQMMPREASLLDGCIRMNVVDFKLCSVELYAVISLVPLCR